jgi:endonuclease YncB( thermonuclease family)
MEEARLGLAATQKLKELLGSGTVTISGSGHDQYGRELREVRVNGRDVGETMISARLARSYDGKKRQEWC